MAPAAANGKAAGQESLRAVNRSLVLDVLRAGGAYSRPQLAELTGLTLPTVGAIVDELLGERLVVDRGAAAGSVRGGRRPRLVEFNPSSRHVLGVSIGVHRTVVAVGDARGEVVAKLQEATPAPAEPDRVVSLIAALARRMTHELPVEAAGLCVPGLVERRTGVCLAARNLGWDVVPIGAMLEQALGGIQVMALNATQAAAVAESFRGVASGVEDLVWIHVGTGIGAGIVSGGRLLRGARGLAGEFGHGPIREDGPPCSCGKRGCLEAIASGGAIMRQAHELGLTEAGDEEGLDSILRRGAEGDPVAGKLLSAAGHEVGKAAVGLLHLLNPEQLVLGGAIGQVEGPFTVALRTSVAQYTIPFTLASSAIVCSTLGPDAGIQGALLVARQEADPSLRLMMGSSV